jgi:proteic killer suppression protein
MARNPKADGFKLPVERAYLKFRQRLIVACHVTDYTFSCDQDICRSTHTRDLYVQGKSKWFPPEITRRAIRKLEYLNLATGLDDLKVPPSNRLHELERERSEQFSISFNDQWRICFRFADGDAFDVELTDYH